MKKIDKKMLIFVRKDVFFFFFFVEIRTWYASPHAEGFFFFFSWDRWKADLKLRIVQHNIRTVAGYYKQITTKRLAELLGLDEGQAERHVAGIVVWLPTSAGDLTVHAVTHPRLVFVFASSLLLLGRLLEALRSL